MLATRVRSPTTWLDLTWHTPFRPRRSPRKGGGRKKLGPGCSLAQLLAQSASCCVTAQRQHYALWEWSYVYVHTYILTYTDVRIWLLSYSYVCISPLILTKFRPSRKCESANIDRSNNQIKSKYVYTFAKVPAICDLRTCFVQCSQCAWFGIILNIGWSKIYLKTRKREVAHKLTQWGNREKTVQRWLEHQLGWNLYRMLGYRLQNIIVILLTKWFESMRSERTR